VKKALERLKVPVVQVARECGLKTPGTLNNWLNGKKTGRVSTQKAGDAAIRWLANREGGDPGSGGGGGGENTSEPWDEHMRYGREYTHEEGYVLADLLSSRATACLMGGTEDLSHLLNRLFVAQDRARCSYVALKYATALAVYKSHQAGRRVTIGEKLAHEWDVLVTYVKARIGYRELAKDLHNK
jgi:hypothetical protein